MFLRLTPRLCGAVAPIDCVSDLRSPAFSILRMFLAYINELWLCPFLRAEVYACSGGICQKERRLD